ncbi:SAF domain-containing protein [Demetria terragena]|uniref:SAF domain-containing protein n=1 Tax=Demetria terragena TaxID=63959 RepID=UPI000369893A|nr:SAF domain-containing protein [Demetria terragena]
MSQGRNVRKAEWHRLRLRRLLAAVLVGAAVVVGLSAMRPAAPATVQVLVAARDLPAGAEITSDDLTRVQWPTLAVPTDRLSTRQVVGRRALGPIRSGAPVTATRLIERRTLPATDGDVVVSMPLSDPSLTQVLRVGDQVDVLAPTGAAPARSAQIVGMTTPSSDSAWKGPSGGSILLAVNGREAAAIAQAQASGVGGAGSLMVALAVRR